MRRIQSQFRTNRTDLSPDTPHPARPQRDHRPQWGRLVAFSFLDKHHSMPRIYADLNHTEQKAVQRLLENSSLEKPQPILRALIKMLSKDEGLRQRALENAEARERLDPHPDHAPGFQKHLAAEDYEQAIAEAGSLKGAADVLGVHRSTVREMAELHEIPVPTLGGVPE